MLPLELTVLKPLPLITPKRERIEPRQSTTQRVADWKKASIEDVAKSMRRPQMAEPLREFISSVRDPATPVPAIAVYAIQAGDSDVCKIGVAFNPVERLINHQVSNWQELTLDCLLWIFGGRARAVEKIAIESAKAAGRHIRGEWIMAAPDEAALLIAAAAKSIGAFVADSDLYARAFQKRVNAIQCAAA